MLLIIQQKSFEFLPLIIQLILIWLKNSTQNIQKYMQIWRIPMSPLGASTNFPGHVTTYFRTSMSEASPPQGPDIWYLTFYQKKVLIYQAIVTNSLSFKIAHKPLLYESMEQNHTSGPINSQTLGYLWTKHHRCTCMWNWTETPTVSSRLRANTV